MNKSAQPTSELSCCSSPTSPLKVPLICSPHFSPLGGAEILISKFSECEIVFIIYRKSQNLGPNDQFVRYLILPASKWTIIILVNCWWVWKCSCSMLYITIILGLRFYACLSILPSKLFSFSGNKSLPRTNFLPFQKSRNFILFSVFLLRTFVKAWKWWGLLWTKTRVLITLQNIFRTVFVWKLIIDHFFEEIVLEEISLDIIFLGTCFDNVDIMARFRENILKSG